MDTKEAWINEVISSADYMQRAPIPAALRGSIIQNMTSFKPRTVMLRRTTVLSIAAGIALLAGLNIGLLLIHGRHTLEQLSNEANPVASEYFISPPSI